MGKYAKKQSAAQLREYRRQREPEEREKQRRQNRIILWTLAGIAAVALIGVVIGILVNQLRKEPDPISETIVPDVDQMNGAQFTETDQTTEYVRLTVSYTDANGAEQQGDIIIRLRTDIAPVTVQNFQKLVGEHFYDGLTFHRVVSGFMIQGGDPEGTGSGGSDETIRGEFLANGITNNLTHVRGVISMARSPSSYNSASSQFFIVHEDSPHLDGNYAAFGYVVSGMSTVDGIAGTEVEYNSSGEESDPVNPVTIVEAVFVETAEGETQADSMAEPTAPEVHQMAASSFTEADRTTEYVRLTVSCTEETCAVRQKRVFL